MNPETRELLRQLADRLDASQADTLQMALRLLLKTI